MPPLHSLSIQNCIKQAFTFYIFPLSPVRKTFPFSYVFLHFFMLLLTLCLCILTSAQLMLYSDEISNGFVCRDLGEVDNIYSR